MSDEYAAQDDGTYPDEPLHGTPARWQRYWKTIVAVVGAAVVIGNEVAEAVSTAYGDGKFETNDAVTIGIAVATAIGVYAKRNTPAPHA